MRWTHLLPALIPAVVFATALLDANEVDFNRDIRPILSNNCFLCHGPDQDGLEAGLRLDLRDGAIKPLESGETAIVPGKPEMSELLARISSDDESLRMPPAEHGAKLSEAEIDKVRRWIQQGAPYAAHWSYTQPQRPATPEVPSELANWPRNPIDHFVLQQMLAHGLRPSPTADRYALARRVFLDLTGLPPSVAEVDAFVEDSDPQAYEKLVDDLLRRPAFGEHWARKWLDLARYADSAGYADDPPRTIWAYRDWVIRSMNDNQPFDQFTVQQLAGDLLPNPTQQQLIATAFHRNTLTNNEGGTQDEEFRNVAVVDRVNTTMAVWMGTTMACAQCHSHKYDPITQDEYFQFFAIFNNTEDADRRDESPRVEIFTDEQKQQQQDLEMQIQQLTKQLATPTPELASSQAAWEKRLRKAPSWRGLEPAEARRESGKPIEIGKDHSVLLQEAVDRDSTIVTLPLEPGVSVSALRLETLPHESLPGKGAGLGGGNFVVTGIGAELAPLGDAPPTAKFVRITNNGKGQILSLAEVQVFSEGVNVALQGKAKQHSTDYGGPPELAIDGNTDGNFDNKSVTHTKTVADPWWELAFDSAVAVERVAIWNRTDNNLHTRLNNFTIELLDEERKVVWSDRIEQAPNPSESYTPSNVRALRFRAASADYHQPNFEPDDVLKSSSGLGKQAGANDGWAVGGSTDKSHALVLTLDTPLKVEVPSNLRVTIAQMSPHAKHLLGHFRLSVTDDPTAIERAQLPGELLQLIDRRTDSDVDGSAESQLSQYYRETLAPELATQRGQLAKAQQQRKALKPATSVPIMRERDAQRVTHLQFRGNYLDKGKQLDRGLPSAFPAENAASPLDRMAVAHWLTSSDNPLTSRVLANRYWESIFGQGIVVTSEEFGSQGEPPTHPELLDWLATELLKNAWDRKAFLKLLVTSATYRQSAKVSDPAADPDNRWLSRGPRVRLTAEMVRDQALFASGLLSDKMYGPPVRPPQPSLGLTAAFGSSTDWKTSQGEDRYRRGIYTTWRRSNPYPSMATFDAPNREVCTVRRNRTNTPLQSLVTLNDPVYVEAAQALARIALQHDGPLEAKLTLAFRRCLLRQPAPGEVDSLRTLFQDAHGQLEGQAAEAKQLATEPLGPLDDGVDHVNAAAMTVVCNVLLNLDEMFLKR